MATPAALQLEPGPRKLRLETETLGMATGLLDDATPQAGGAGSGGT